MSRLMDSLQTKDVKTMNGMNTNSTSLDSNVDAFFRLGAMRGESYNNIESVFSKAYAENPETALRLAFWVRDIRGGSGERQIFKDIIKFLSISNKKQLTNIISLIPIYGRWDDILCLLDTDISKKYISSVIWSGLTNSETSQLVSKWMPRKGKYAEILRKEFNLTPKEWRKRLVEGSNTVEQLMCSKRWSEIEYNKLPSVASARYQKSFSKNDENRYNKYRESLENGETTINAGAIYPYDVIKSLRHGDVSLANSQWKALPNYMSETTERILPVVDVSGSMSCSAGNSQTISCLDVAVSLGVYISERNVGMFKDYFMTFSESPNLQHLTGDLSSRMSQIKRQVAYNTNIESTFDMLLFTAIRNRLSGADMPTVLLFLSDMEFDSAQAGWNNDSKWNPTVQELAIRKYEDAGYKLPKIVYWNINSVHNNIPVQADTSNTALVSGFSPSILKSILSSKDFTPVSVMNETLYSERYDVVREYLLDENKN